MSDTTRNCRQVDSQELIHLRELASALQHPRLVQSWVKALQSNGFVSIPAALYDCLTVSQKRDVDGVINQLIFAIECGAEDLTLSFK